MFVIDVVAFYILKGCLNAKTPVATVSLSDLCSHKNQLLQLYPAYSFLSGDSSRSSIAAASGP